MRRFFYTIKPARKKSETAFTVVELMVVVGVLAILAALLLPALARAKEKSYRTQCGNNLKQIAVAFHLYASDHDDRLPGPAWLGFYENYDNQDTARLPFYLATYLGLPAPGSTPQYMALARCPSAARHWSAPEPGTPLMGLNMPLSYMANPVVTNINSGVVTRPFGYPNSSPSTNTYEAPKRFSEIYNPALSWALTDVDQQNGFPAALYYWYQPINPVHGNVRNQLFFDSHVAATAQ
jgi:prepilin-type processing-associated H-X9-DG protein